MPQQLMRYALPINNLKIYCSYQARQHAMLLAQKNGLAIEADPGRISEKQHRKIRQYARAAGFVFDDFDRQHIEGFSFVRIYKEAPVLFRLINHLDKSFQVALRADPLEGNSQPAHMVHLSTSYSKAASFLATVKKASYFLTSGKVWRIDPESKNHQFRVGFNCGLANVQESSISFNLEFQLNLEVFLHEIAHLKYPHWNEKIIREAAALIAKDSPAFLSRVEWLKPKLDEEITRIARDFARFDQRVGRILGINEKDRLPRIEPGAALAYGEAGWGGPAGLRNKDLVLGIQ